MIEVAISLWIFLFIGFGLVEGAWLAFANGTLQHAVEEGARVALRPSTATETDVKNAVIDASAGMLTAGDIIVGFCPVAGTCEEQCGNVTAYGTPPRPAGRQIRVCASYTHHPLFLSLIVGSTTVPLHRQAQVRSE
jgi:Flp pilus assembly protein TadG